MTGPQVVVHQHDYHRNGGSGGGFYAVIFAWPVAAPGLFLATLPEPYVNQCAARQVAIETRQPLDLAREYFGCREVRDVECFVINLDMIEKEGVTFGVNSWRGDLVADEIVAHILTSDAEEWASKRKRCADYCESRAGLDAPPDERSE